MFSTRITQKEKRWKDGIININVKRKLFKDRKEFFFNNRLRF